MPWSIAMIAIISIIFGTMMIATIATGFFKLLRSRHQPAQTPESLTTSELHEMIADAVADATEPLVDRIEALEQRAAAGHLPPARTGLLDAADGSGCPENGRLPDASLGADHLREVFGRMGFDDRDIVALSGGHTVGRCHKVRSGYDGAWTSNPLVFDNEYFKNLLNNEWTEKKWDGEFQYTDPTDTLVMLPTDMALITDEKFRPFVETYAADEQAFFDDFSKAYAKTGWRIGYMILPEALKKQVLKVHDVTIICAPRISQLAALTALTEESVDVREFEQILARRRNVICGRLDRVPHVFSYVKPEGAYYVFPRIVAEHEDSFEFCLRLLDAARVTLTPGSAFGPAGAHHVRMAFCVPEETIEQAFDRMERYYGS